jgi:hypothetical protein
MKTHIVIILISLVSLSRGIAQDLLLGVHSEVTVAGAQHGGLLSIESKKKFALGVLYQQEFRVRPEQEHINTLRAVQLQAPIVRSEKLSLLGNIRVGQANQKFLVVIPGVETRWSITKNSGISLGMSLRMGYPSISGRIYTTLF